MLQINTPFGLQSLGIAELQPSNWRIFPWSDAIFPGLMTLETPAATTDKTVH